MSSDAATTRCHPDPPRLRLEGRHTRLVPVDEPDADFLYHLVTSDAVSPRWRYRGSMPSRSEIRDSVQRDALAQFLLLATTESTPMRAGLLVAYGQDLKSRHCYFGVAVDEPYFGTGVGIEGVFLFVSYLFETWDFRKVYAEVPAFNLSAFGRSVSRYFDVEGRLSEHHYSGGRYWDTHILGVTRFDWFERSKAMLAYIRRESG